MAKAVKNRYICFIKGVLLLYYNTGRMVNLTPPPPSDTIRANIRIHSPDLRDMVDYREEPNIKFFFFLFWFETLGIFRD